MLAAAMLTDRISKRFRHLSKWSRRTDAPCFRVYERDIPEFPLVIDWYDGDVVLWIHPRRKDETPEQEESFARASAESVKFALKVDDTRLFVKRRMRQRGLAQYERESDQGIRRVVIEHGLKFEINLSDYLDTGLFLDHRATRQMIRDRARGQRVLNLFAYTGAFTVHAIAGGAAATLTVDMSNTYQSWTRRNLELNTMAPSAEHRLEAADCLQMLEAGPKRGEAWDIIVLDPPTFSNSKRMASGSFSVDRDWAQLVAHAVDWLSPRGQIWFSTNSRSFRPDDAALPTGVGMREITKYTVPEDFSGRTPHRAYLIARAGDTDALDLRVTRWTAPAARGGSSAGATPES